MGIPAQPPHTLALLRVVSWIALVACGAVFLTATCARADDPWPADSPYRGWADQQQVMPGSARVRFSCNQPPATCSCCHQADIVRTKFRVADDDSDAWDWFNPTIKDWQRVPDDVIHWGEPTPTQEGVIFVNGGRVLCFFPPQEGGG